MSYYDSPRHGWGTRSPLEVLGRTAAVHAVLLINYFHLQRTQKVEYSSRTVRVLRLVLFGFMPTLVFAEFFLNACRIFLLFLHSDSAKLTFKIALSNWKRYLCGLAGMHVVPKPEFEQDITDVEEAAEDRQSENLPADDQPSSSSEVDGGATSRPAPAEILPRLSKIQDSDDLEHHRQRWTFGVVGRILLLILPIAQAVGTMILWQRRVGYWAWHEPLSLDKRNFVAALSSILCSLLAITILSCRSEWSLKTLNSAGTNTGDYIVRVFFLEIVIASILNEGPFTDTWWVQPFSWIEAVKDAFGFSGILFFICFGLLVWLLVWGFDDKIKQRVTINWHFVLGIPVTIITIWIFIDLIGYFIYNIAQLVDHVHASGIWDSDPWAKYLPIC